MGGTEGREADGTVSPAFEALIETGLCYIAVGGVTVNRRSRVQGTVDMGFSARNSLASDTIPHDAFDAQLIRHDGPDATLRYRHHLRAQR